MGQSPSKQPGGGPPSPVNQNNTQKAHHRLPIRRESVQASHASRSSDSRSSEPTNNPTSHSTELHSSQRPSAHHHHHHPRQQPSSESPSSQRTHREERMGNSQSQQEWKEKTEVWKREQREHEPQSVPVRVPGSTQEKRQRGPDSQFEPSGPPRDPNYVLVSNLNFPPRLPLPIQEEVHTPGSPIISPQDLSTALHEDDVDGALPRRASLLSHTTFDDDELDDEYGYGPEALKGRTVPTLVYWKQGGDKVYITGTFASWSRKYRMHRDSHTQIASTSLDLPPGTHHVKFIVDGEMQLSNELPTAVDYTNILVNYIEVSADDLPSEQTPEEKALEGIFPPLILPPEIEVKNLRIPETVGQSQQPENEMPIESLYYGDQVPEYLLDLDRDEKSNRFQRAAQSISEIPTPPSLPLFLSKSILNGTTPMKDDSSVLNMPNHTVLNHLATSSIKNDVLATSLTTRYKRKYVTTIMYRPTNIDGD